MYNMSFALCKPSTKKIVAPFFIGLTLIMCLVDDAGSSVKQSRKEQMLIYGVAVVAGLSLKKRFLSDDTDRYTVNESCIDFKVLNEVPLNQPDFNTSELIDYVQSRAGAQASKRKGISTENAPIEEVPGLGELFITLWKSSLKGGCNDSFISDLKFEVDIFVEQAETQRSGDPHFHPMPLLTNTIPVKRSDALKGLPLLVLDDKSEVQATMAQFIPLAEGTMHHEDNGAKREENRIFIVIVPTTSALQFFRHVRSQHPQHTRHILARASQKVVGLRGAQIKLPGMPYLKVEKLPRSTTDWEKIDTVGGRKIGTTCGRDVGECVLNLEKRFSANMLAHKVQERGPTALQH